VQTLADPVNRKEIQIPEGTILDGVVLHKLYQLRDRAEKKKGATQEARAQRMSQQVSRNNEGKATTRYQSTLQNLKHLGYLRKHNTSRDIQWKIGNLIFRI